MQKWKNIRNTSNEKRLTALDHPEVRKVASQYGNSDLLLKEDWIAPIPGIRVEGKYEDYAKNPLGD